MSPSKNWWNPTLCNIFGYIAERTKAAVIGITESIGINWNQLEIQIDNCDLLRCDRNRNGGSVAC